MARIDRYNGRNPSRGHSRGNSRQQATRFAVLAFVAADCAGIYYVQQRLEHQSAAAAELAYQTPGAPALSGPGSLTFTPDAPALALNAPVTAAPTPARSVTVPAAAGRALLPVAANARHMAVRLAPAGDAAPTPHKTLARAQGKAMHHDAHSAPNAAHLASSSVFDSAFTLADEAPDSEHRFGQGPAGADSANASGTGLAGLVIPRDEVAPMFDKAGIAPVTGQSATVDIPAATDVPADGAAAELPPING